MSRPLSKKLGRITMAPAPTTAAARSPVRPIGRDKLLPPIDSLSVAMAHHGGVPRLRVRLLGPVRAWRGEQEIPLGPTRQRAVLAVLALSAGRPVNRDELIWALWRDEPPQQAINIIQTYVKHLRQALEPDRARRTHSTLLPRVGDGYTLDVDPDAVDALVFGRLVTQARAAHRDHRAAEVMELAGTALDMWQPPLADVPLLADHSQVAALAGQRWTAVGLYADAAIAQGSAADVLTTVEQAADAQPLDESAQARLMRVYHALGRRADALAVYDRTRRRLADELGVDPGPDLAGPFDTILREEPTPTSADDGARWQVRPAQLPADIPAFTGRDDSLKQLDQLLGGEQHETAVVISAIAGTAGIGKTALAVHWAYRVRAHFPDGQLYVNLRGFDPAGAVTRPAEALRAFLDALAVPPARIPASLDAQVGLYRSLLADRRMLVLLDNARDPDQVRPLLPGAPGCLALITSRNQLTGLVVAQGARPLTLDLLPAAEARDLLALRLGAERVATEPDAVDDIVDSCARLPLALAIAAARAAVNPEQPLGTLAGELRRTRDRLAPFAGDDPATDLRAVLSCSYQALGAGAARLFRLLGLHPGPDICAPAAASLAAIPRTQATATLDELVRANLISEPTPGRYAFHDLLRAYAAELVETVETQADRRAALRRLLDHYLHTAHCAAMLLKPLRDPIILGPPAPGITPEEFADHDEALAWFTVERRVLSAAVDRAGGTGFDVHAWQLAWAVADFFDRQGLWHDQCAAQQAALAAARRLSDQRAMAFAHRGFAAAQMNLGHYDDADRHFRHALDLYRELGDLPGQAITHRSIALVFEWQESYQPALHHAEQALDMYRAAGHRIGQATALNNFGWYHAQLGNHEQALACCQEALALQQELGDRHGQAQTWDSVGYAHHHLGRHDEAVACYRQSVKLFREVGDRFNEADTLRRLGETYLAMGHADRAGDAWRPALAILDEIGHADADAVRDKLRKLG
jgi:DNA-binding SARP family transcriptional activator/Tfp pilus assembly protein PilF